MPMHPAEASPAQRNVMENAITSDPSGFWEVLHVYPGRGGSTITRAKHVFENGVAVSHRFYNPGPFDVIAFGADSSVAQPKSTYTVYTGIFGQPDELSKDDAIALVTAAHPHVDLAALKAGEADIWSPDGEGALFWTFGDMDVEHALRLAPSLEAALVLAS